MIVLISIVFGCSSAGAQEATQSKNIIITNYSFAFFGSGVGSGSSIGIHYHRSLFGRFGVNLGYSKATGSGEGQYDIVRRGQEVEGVPVRVDGLEVRGQGPYPLSIEYYDILNLGLSYKVSDGDRQSLLASVGYNYKRIQGSRLSTVYASSNNTVTVQGAVVNGESEGGVYLGLDYLYYINDSVSFGIHLNVDNSGSIVSKAGASIGYRF